MQPPATKLKNKEKSPVIAPVPKSEKTACTVKNVERLLFQEADRRISPPYRWLFFRSFGSFRLAHSTP